MCMLSLALASQENNDHHDGRDGHCHEYSDHDENQEELYRTETANECW